MGHRPPKNSSVAPAKICMICWGSSPSLDIDIQHKDYCPRQPDRQIYDLAMARKEYIAGHINVDEFVELVSIL